MGQEPASGRLLRRVPLKAALIGIAATGLLGAWAPTALACPTADVGAAYQTTEQARLSVVCLINKNRRHNGAKPVNENSLLDSAAQGHTDAMTSQNFFSHAGDGTPASRASNAGFMAGARAWGIGEDLFWGTSRFSTPNATVRAWMHSAEHRTVLLSRSYRQVGIGADQGSPAGADDTNSGTYTAMFGFRKG